ncbi:hypothetical protein [Hyphomonas oceanitis]|uniref:hypothetical protein n=1 Tax=Hyphomonas oceanitis TaxID=81033 RepID=UPI00300248FA
MKRVLLSALILSLYGRAAADTFCNHEIGMIGTKAIGYVIPYGPMMSEDTDLSAASHDQDICRIISFDGPMPVGPTRLDDCQNFQHVRSDNVIETGHIFTDEEAKIGHPVSEYFSPLVFAVEGQMAALELKTGETRWVQSDHLARGVPTYFEPSVYDGKSAVGYEGGISSDVLYAQAAAGAETQPPSNRGPAQDAFRDKVLAGHPHDEAALLQMEVHSGFIYRVTDVVTVADGSVWFELEEKAALSSWNWPAEVLAIYGNDASRLTSDPIRTVYMPFRKPDGTVVAVLTSGFDCGC